MTDLEREVRTVLAQVEAGQMEPHDAINHLAYWIGFDHTPTTEEVRKQWDRLLADIERNVAAVAWDEGATAAYNDDAHGSDDAFWRTNPYRADRIEQGGQS